MLQVNIPISCLKCDELKERIRKLTKEKDFMLNIRSNPEPDEIQEAKDLDYYQTVIDSAKLDLQQHQDIDH